jgi:outer membrane protein assembly factor BamA
MRGFIQNARNGTNFFVMNNELRFPVIKYIANRPLNSSFLNNFQVVGFADIGSAWSGLTPNDASNAYNTETVKKGPVTVIIDKNRWPVVYGYGFGLRSKLFGYFFRLDWAWGVDNDIILPRQFYFSLSLDF